MAKDKPNNERTEREFQLDVNQAVANTEGEIFEDALSDEPLENDGDTSLEEMGEGLEGDDLEEGEGPDEETGDKEADEETEGDEEEPAEGEEAEAAEDDEEEQPRDQQGRFEDRQPPDRREIPLKAERDRRREAEERAERLERELAEMRGRVDEVSRRVNAPPPQVEQPRPSKPDMFADPDGYDRWVREEARREAQDLVSQRIQAYELQQQQVKEARVNANLAQAASSDRGWEFGAAYNSLVGLDKQNPAHRAIVQRIFDAPDPGKELFNWWDENGGEDYRERIRAQLLPRQDRGNSRQRSQQPRHETRLPESLRRTPPSLNSARGGQRQEVQDPEMMDDSDDSVFRFAARR